LGYKIYEVLKFVDKPKIGTVTVAQCKQLFDEYIVDEAINEGYLEARAKIPTVFAS
jgi:hypothetical protein